MKLHLDLINQSKQIQELCNKLKHETSIAIDTEFIRERTYYPKLALIQIATEQEAWLIDAPALSKQELQPLFEVLCDPNILKFLHSAHGDQECFYSTYQLTATATLDTYEAASLLGYGESVSLRDLIYRSTNIKIPKFLTRTNWLKRPIGEEMRRYAIADVEHLVVIGNNLIKELEACGRKEWALHLSRLNEDPARYQANPELMAKKLSKSGKVKFRNYPIFYDLINWREQRAQSLDIPRKRIADDDTLINIANSRPKDEEQLKKFRGINPGEIKHHGKTLIKLINRDHSENSFSAPAPPRIIKPTPSQSRVIDFLSTYLKAICQEFKIASRLIFTVKELQRIVVEDLKNPEQWIENKLCSPEAASLVGDRIASALDGKCALAIQDGKLNILKL